MTGRVKNQPSVLSQPVFFPPQSKTGQLFLTAAALRNLPPFFLRMSSVFQALLDLTAAKDRRESSSEGRGGGVWLAARLTTLQQGCE